MPYRHATSCDAGLPVRAWFGEVGGLAERIETAHELQAERSRSVHTKSQLPRMKTFRPAIESLRLELSQALSCDCLFWLLMDRQLIAPTPHVGFSPGPTTGAA